MNAHTIPTADTAADLVAEAHRILANPGDGTCRTAEEWRKAAQAAVDTGGDDVADLLFYIEEQEVAERRWPIDEDGEPYRIGGLAHWERGQ